MSEVQAKSGDGHRFAEPRGDPRSAISASPIEIVTTLSFPSLRILLKTKQWSLKLGILSRNLSY
jgi:hypothetical protein